LKPVDPPVKLDSGKVLPLLELEELVKLGLNWRSTGYPRRVWFDSVRYWSVTNQEISQRIERNRARKVSRAKMGNNFGSFKGPTKDLLNEKQLRRYLERGMGLYSISTKERVSESVVKSSMRHYQLEQLEKTLPQVAARNFHLLERLDTLYPGLVDQFRTDYFEDPVALTNTLHDILREMLCMQVFIQQAGKAAALPLAQRPKNVSWSTNIYEALLSLALDQVSLSYERAAPLGPYWVDFLVEGKLYVEVDGRYHDQESTKIRDAKKEKLMGLPLLRISTSRIVTDMDGCLEEIQKFLSSL
jgi:very-short-patch-repair endonuclease